MYGPMYSMYGENFKFRAYTTEFVAVQQEHYECSKLCKTWKINKPICKNCTKFSLKLKIKAMLYLKQEELLNSPYSCKLFA